MAQTQAELPHIDRFDCDVLIIGGGPGGSTAAALLAQDGRGVVLLDKDAHPRFHIGESLLPANLPLFEHLGVAEQVRAIGMEKWAAEFVSPWHDHMQHFRFGDAWDKSMPYAYQVRRSDFDRLLIDNAAAKGAEVHQRCKVHQVEFARDESGARVTARHDDGREQSWCARYVIDASGRETFLANRFQIKHKNPQHNSLAVYAHFANARRNEGQAEGNISLFWFEHGWFWFIPLVDGATSVGMVTWPYFMKTRGERSLHQFLMDGIALCPPLLERIKDSPCTHPAEATGNFSYLSERNHGPNYLMIGDAFAFIDPVFSSGVMLAMQGGFSARDCLNVCLDQPARKASAMAEFDRISRLGPKHFSWFIYRMTNPILRDMFMGPRNVMRVREALLSLLAGDIYGQTPIWRALRVFKLIYYGMSITQARTAWRAWRRRQVNIRAVDA